MYVEMINNPKSVASEAYRTLRSNIQFSNYENNLKTIVVTSSVPGEGKSTTSLNLSVAFAQLGKKVLLIDADMRKPSIHKRLELSNLTGISTILAGMAEFESAIQILKSDTYEFSVITSGEIPPNPAEMLNSQKMVQLLDILKSYYDIIIIDSPPVLAVTDSQVMARLTDGLVLVSDIKTTKKKEILEAKNLLDKAQANIIGVVINKVDAENDNNYYYYEYK